ncbi:hypothetical protein [Nostoc sp.]|uniref:hypothetical protein n=1 Tax=Nostoc sp. TaxID=1180 RepID=UPI002FFCF895
MRKRTEKSEGRFSLLRTSGRCTNGDGARSLLHRRRMVAVALSIADLKIVFPMSIFD